MFSNSVSIQRKAPLHPHQAEHSYGRGLAVALLFAIAAWPAWATHTLPQACDNPFTPEEEVTEGAKVAAKVYQQMPILPESDPVSRYVSQLGAHLVTHAPGLKWPYSFHVVASPDINAFALPGGAIFVNLGTVQAADTEAQLAGVMAHEASHVALRHATCNMKKQQTKGIEYGLGSILSQVFLGGRAGQAVAAGLNGLQGLDYLHMSREDEKQADLLGVDILYESGYDPRGLPQFFETVQAKYGEGGAQILSDHPNPGNRTEYVNAQIATLPRRANAMVNSAAFTRTRAIAMQERTFTGQMVKDGVWKNGNYASGPGQVYNNGGYGAQYPNQNGQPGADRPYPGQPDPSNQTTNNGESGQYPNQNGGQDRYPNNGRYGGDGPVALTVSQLALRSRMTTFQGTNFTINYPSRWRGGRDNNGTATFSPVGGAGAFGIVYGAIVDTAKSDGNAVTDEDSLNSAVLSLAQQLGRQNAGLQQITQVMPMNLNGQSAAGIELRGRSPLVEGGDSVPERDWLVAIPRQDGDLNYIVFVAPERDFARLRPTFRNMLGSFKAE